MLAGEQGTMEADELFTVLYVRGDGGLHVWPGRGGGGRNSDMFYKQNQKSGL